MERDSAPKSIGVEAVALRVSALNGNYLKYISDILLQYFDLFYH